MEIEAVLKLQNINFASKMRDVDLLVETEERLDSGEIMKRLGGTVYIAELIGESNSLDVLIADYISKHIPEAKIHFSVHGGEKKLGLIIKKELKARGRSVRYVEPKNTATILHNNLVEKGTDFTISGKEVFVTRAIQPIEELSKRDYGKPGVDSKSGMLPPKLARTMVNLTGLDSGTLLDPFCGSGVLLMEASLLGFDVIGSDISQKAVNDTKKNLKWIEKEGRVFDCDARKISTKVDKETVDAIASEPYLGRPLGGKESLGFLKGQAQELASLYIDSFERFHVVLKENAPVVFIIPRFKYEDDWVTVDCVEQIEKLGFEQTHEPLLYHRKKQFVGREIFFFKKV